MWGAAMEGVFPVNLESIFKMTGKIEGGEKKRALEYLYLETARPVRCRSSRSII